MPTASWALARKPVMLTSVPAWNRILFPSQPEQRVGGAELKVPVHHFTVGILDVDIKPGMWIHPLDLGDRALHRDGLVHVKLGREGVMGGGRHRGPSKPNIARKCEFSS